MVIILLCNIAALLWLESKMPWRSQHRQEKLPSRVAMALESLQLCGVVVLGFLLGLTRLPFLQLATEIVKERRATDDRAKGFGE